MTKINLTTKQQKFCDEFLLGKTKRDALMSAGYSEMTANKSAAAIFDNKNVQKYINAHQAKLSQKTQATFSNKVELLWKMAKVSAADDKAVAVVTCIAELNKMQGHHSAEKHVNVNLKADVDLEQVMKLVKEKKRDY